MFVVGHRGMRYVEPENTLRAIKRALDSGADGVEIDVRTTKDGALVAMHDETVDRTTNGRGRLRDLTLEYVRSLDAGKGERVPTLDEVVEFVKERGILFVELKEPDIVEGVVEVLERTGGERFAVLVSFYHWALLEAKELNDRIATGVIFSCDPVSPHALALEARAELLIPKAAYATRRLVERAHERGLGVAVWVVNTPAELERFRRMGVDAVVTDRADVIAPLVGAERRRRPSLGDLLRR